MSDEASRRSGVFATILLSVALLAGFAAPATAAPAPDAPPAGANDWSCIPAPEHPRPVVLVHGTWANMVTTWDTLSPTLKSQGYCVFALNYGTRDLSTGENLLDMVGGNTISRSARTLAGFVSKVRAATSGRQVDLIGHSQGALVAREYLKSAGGSDAARPERNSVHTLVSLAGTNQGTSFNLNQQLGAIAEMLGIPVVTLASATVGPSYVEQMSGSPFLRQLNAGGDTRPGVTYVALATKNDTMVTPPENAFLNPARGSKVRNIWVQEGCESANVDHMQVTSSPRAVWMTLVALDPGYGRTHQAPCP
ncbi:lipase (class 2) [Williamsia limnetica]|uniref:Lipase (Class 2) n=1 Tax=Williamsia limnetica TaxID=882452 RepID=A0A318RFP0_WILLI|nr:alpha/beta fold hydrolase [Williamsia limnetica]PYE13118.1 lipase (class 2) [Williamsia limnetica]